MVTWQEHAWREFELLQGIVDRQMSIRWQLRAWLLAFHAALTVALFSEKLDPNAFLWAAIAGAVIAWTLEMSEDFVIDRAVSRQTEIEHALSIAYAADEPPRDYAIVAICGSLETTARGWPTILYIGSCFGNFRRVLILVFFLALPVAIRLCLG